MTPTLMKQEHVLVSIMLLYCLYNKWMGILHIDCTNSTITCIILFEQKLGYNSHVHILDRKKLFASHYIIVIVIHNIILIIIIYVISNK